MDTDTARALLDARQLALQSQQRHEDLAWLDELEKARSPALVDLAVARLGFRERKWQDGELFVVDDDELVAVRLQPAALARLVRARADAGWSFGDMRLLIRPGAARVPDRYEPIGTVIEIAGDLPEIVADCDVQPGWTIAFEVERSYREWIVETELGYVGLPAPKVGSNVWRVHAP